MKRLHAVSFPSSLLWRRCCAGSLQFHTEKLLPHYNSNFKIQGYFKDRTWCLETGLLVVPHQKGLKIFNFLMYALVLSEKKDLVPRWSSPKPLLGIALTEKYNPLIQQGSWLSNFLTVWHIDNDPRTHTLYRLRLFWSSLTTHLYLLWCLPSNLASSIGWCIERFSIWTPCWKIPTLFKRSY